VLLWPVVGLGSRAGASPSGAPPSCGLAPRFRPSSWPGAAWPFRLPTVPLSRISTSPRVDSAHARFRGARGPQSFAPGNPGGHLLLGGGSKGRGPGFFWGHVSAGFHCLGVICYSWPKPGLPGPACYPVTRNFAASRGRLDLGSGAFVRWRDYSEAPSAIGRFRGRASRILWDRLKLSWILGGWSHGFAVCPRLTRNGGRRPRNVLPRPQADPTMGAWAYDSPPREGWGWNLEGRCPGPPPYQSAPSQRARPARWDDYFPPQVPEGGPAVPKTIRRPAESGHAATRRKRRGWAGSIGPPPRPSRSVLTHGRSRPAKGARNVDRKVAGKLLGNRKPRQELRFSRQAAPGPRPMGETSTQRHQGGRWDAGHENLGSPGIAGYPSRCLV